MTDDIYTPIVPTPDTDTPQRSATRGLVHNVPLDVYTPKHAELAAQQHALSATAGAPTPLQLEAKLREHLGFQYGFWDRCGGRYHQHDCSGYQCWGYNNDGAGNIGCLSSFTIAQMCWDAGLFISEDEARVTPHWAFHGADNGRRDDGSRPNGASGHIVYANLATIGGTYEAMGRAYGVRVGSWYGRSWTGFYKILGHSYAPPPPPPPPPEEEDMIIVLDPTKPISSTGNKPHAEFVPANAFLPHGAVRCMWGCTIDGDVPVKDHPNTRLWAPTPRNGHKWVGMAGRTNDKGVVLIDDTGYTTPDTQGLWS